MLSKNELVVKSNRLIEATYKLDITEQRIILLAITGARKHQLGMDSTSFYEIKAQDYAEMFNISPNTAYKELRSVAKSLFNRYFGIRTKDLITGVVQIEEHRWLSAVKYVEGHNLIELQFTPIVVPEITRLSGSHTQYRIGIISNMTSSYAIRMYELLLQYQSIGYRTFELNEIKELLNVQAEKAYTHLSHFKKHVIDIAINQINELSDLDVSYENVKTGRTVTGLKFSIKFKSNIKTVGAEPQNIRPPALPKLEMIKPDFSQFSNLEKGLFKDLNKVNPNVTLEQVYAKMIEGNVEAVIALNQLIQEHTYI